MPNWLDLTEISLLLITCWFCYTAGKTQGISDIIELLITKKIVTKEDLRKLEQ